LFAAEVVSIPLRFLVALRGACTRGAAKCGNSAADLFVPCMAGKLGRVREPEDRRDHAPRLGAKEQLA